MYLTFNLYKSFMKYTTYITYTIKILNIYIKCVDIEIECASAPKHIL